MMNHVQEVMILTNKNIVLAYKGNFTNELFQNLIQLAELKLEVIETNYKLKKKVFGVVVEVLQNIYHHFEDQLMHGKFFNITFKIRKINSGYLILTGNPIPKNKIQQLQESLETLNNMSPKELTVKYRSTLGNHVFSSKGGAGLGLLYMVKKSGSKVDYKFHTFNSDYSFFNLKVKVSA